MRFATAAAAVLTLATPALPQSAISTEIGQTGIAATLARLEAQAEKTPAEIFATGGLHSLVTFERTLQWQWRTGSNIIISMALGITTIDSDLPKNPAPQAITGATLADLTASIDTGMQNTLTALKALPQDADFDLEISLRDLWFDVNMNNRRDAGEDGGAILAEYMVGLNWRDRDPTAALPTIRFDSADAAWLSAHSHRLSALVNGVLAYDPFAPIDRVIATRAALNAPELGDQQGAEGVFPFAVDATFVTEQTLLQTPDAQRIAATKSHLLQMIAEYRRFWAMVDAEQDDDREWIPNIRQTSAFGLALPPPTRDGWLFTLTHAEEVLNGDLLLPFWRGSADQGIDISRFFATPQPIDLMRSIQGVDIVPYLQKGKVASPQSLDRIGQIVFGNYQQMMEFMD